MNPIEDESASNQSETIEPELKSEFISEQAANSLKHQVLQDDQWRYFDEVPLQAVDKRYSTLLAIEHVLFALLVLTVSSLSTTLILKMPAELILTIISALCAVLITSGVVRQAQAKRLSFAVCEHELLLQKGLIWQQRISLPYTRLQHVSLSQGPLERRFELSTLKCFSAGSGSAEIDLPGIEKTQAEQLRQHLLAQAGLNSVKPKIEESSVTQNDSDDIDRSKDESSQPAETHSHD